MLWIAGLPPEQFKIVLRKKKPKDGIYNHFKVALKSYKAFANSYKCVVQL